MLRLALSNSALARATCANTNVQPVWAEHYESERNHEQQLCAKARESLPGQLWVSCDDCLGVSRLLFFFFNG